uniref:Gamma-glutamyltransferase n=1 Tax=Angiostrongylus cantonensis TaxID=6313 RepID=A0A0K0D2C1_ANGCA
MLANVSMKKVVAVNGVDVKPHCIIVGSMVTSLCTAMGAGMMCDINMNMNIGAIPPQHLSISGSLMTTNVIMANWSREMWQSVVNRAVRMLASGPFGANFFSAVATVS